VELVTGGEAGLEAVSRRLSDMAYARVDLVTKRGEFAVRGGILDVFPPTDEHPSRVEFWGDEVEEIRTFAVADQRTIDPVQRLWAPPCRELLLTRRCASAPPSWPRSTPSWPKSSTSWPRASRLRDESLAPALLQGTASMELLLDCMPAGAHVLLCDPERIRTRAHDLVRTSAEFLEAAGPPPRSAARPRSTSAPHLPHPAEVRAEAGALRLPWWTISPFGLVEAEDEKPDQPWLDPTPVSVSPDLGDAIALQAQPVPLYPATPRGWFADLQGWVADNCRWRWSSRATARRNARSRCYATRAWAPPSWTASTSPSSRPAAGHLRRP